MRVLVSDVRQRPAANATVVFQFVQPPGLPLLARADTVRTDANGEAKLNAAIGPFPAQYKIIATVANARVEPVVVDVNVTADAPARIQIRLEFGPVRVGSVVPIVVHSVDHFGNVAPIGVPVRTLTPLILDVTTAPNGSQSVLGRAVGTGLLVAEHAGLVDTARVIVGAR